MITNQQIINKLTQIQKEVKDLSNYKTGTKYAKSMLRIRSKLVVANIKLLQAYLSPKAVCDSCEQEVLNSELVYNINLIDILCRECYNKDLEVFQGD